MMHPLAALLLAGLFTEVRTPAEGYQCLVVRSGRHYYIAIKHERSRLTDRVTLTMPVQNIRILAGLPPDPGRTIDLDKSDMVTDTNTCKCPYALPRDLTCLDQ